MLAIWQQPTDDSNSWIVIERSTGELVRRLDSDTEESPAGWLNDTTLLLVRIPPLGDGEQPGPYSERVRRESELIAVDVRSGSERVILQGDVGQAAAAPDGLSVAIFSTYDASWPGSTLEIRPFD